MLRHSKLTRNLFIVLFVWSALTVGLIPNASSQQFTTSTSILTSSLTQTATYNLFSFTTSTWTGNGTFTGSVEFGTIGNATDFHCAISWGQFNSTGMTHLEYSVIGPMTFFIYASGGLNSFANALSPLAVVGAAEGLKGCNAANDAPQWSNYPHYSWDISATSYPAAGSFNVNLPPNLNPYYYGMIVPRSKSYLTGTLSISPLWGVYTNTATSTIPTTLLKTSVTTLTFRSTLEVPFMQTYGSWIAAVIVGTLVVAMLFFALRRSRHARKPRRHH